MVMTPMAMMKIIFTITIIIITTIIPISARVLSAVKTVGAPAPAGASPLQWLGAGLEPGLPRGPAMQLVESFVVEQGLQARAATVLRGQRPSVQEAVIARGALLGTRPMDLELFCRVQEDS